MTIARLTQPPGASTACAALVEASRGAYYFRTRAAAVAALGRFGARAAAALATALRDTSAQVRRAAIAALGEVGGGARAAELARATWHGDSSYEVRAAALTALVRADTTARDSAVVWGLETPSYQDVIQEATYRIIAQTGDTAAIPRVEARIATDRLAAHVLAALAARGSARALDVLAAHLNDDRAAARRWVVEAFQFTLPRQLRSEEHTSELQSPMY